MTMTLFRHRDDKKSIPLRDRRHVALVTAVTPQIRINVAYSEDVLGSPARPKKAQTAFPMSFAVIFFGAARMVNHSFNSGCLPLMAQKLTSGCNSIAHAWSSGVSAASTPFIFAAIHQVWRLIFLPVRARCTSHTSTSRIGRFREAARSTIVSVWSGRLPPPR